MYEYVEIPSNVILSASEESRILLEKREILRLSQDDSCEWSGGRGDNDHHRIPHRTWRWAALLVGSMVREVVWCSV